MRIASFLREGGEGYGLVEGEAVRPAAPEFARAYPSLRALLAAGKPAELPDHCLPQVLPLASLTLLPPIPAPSKILCVGLNYKKPYPVAGVAPQSDTVVIFGRHDESLVGHGARLEMPAGEAALTYDYEGEIVAVIGRTCRHVAPDAALDYVAGYACMNEGSVRGWQKHSVHAGKNFFASGAWGPWLTTADEAGRRRCDW